ncbi:MAG TPA: hypothetical protein VGG61_15455 [Gemmataceae bacterium]|jgi:hypothetical protein
MPANKFVLKGSHVVVEYTIGGNPSFPALTYTDGAFQRSFKPDAIKTDDTGLGKLVSIPLVSSIDVGGERFGFFLPAIDVPSGETAHFHTIGIYEMFSGPDSIPHRPSTWRCIEMSGTAQTVIVPL